MRVVLFRHQRVVAEKVFGPNRRELLEVYLGTLDTVNVEDTNIQKDSLLLALAEVESRQARQVLAFERDDDPDGLVSVPLGGIRLEPRELSRLLSVPPTGFEPVFPP